MREVREQKHRGATYQQRVKTKGEPEFIFRSGRLLAISGQESAIKQLIELDAADAAGTIELADRLAALKARDAMATLWLNPRSFDALRDKARTAMPRPPSSRLFPNAGALEGIAITLNANDVIDVDAGDHSAKLPPNLLKVAGGLNVLSTRRGLPEDDC